MNLRSSIPRLTLACLLVGATSGALSQPSAATPQPLSGGSQSTTASTGTACAVRDGQGDYPNPAMECPAADPGMVIQGSTWDAFTTGLHHYRSTDSGHTWTDLGTFLTIPAGYVDAWAPEVYAIDGQWVAYFNMRTGSGQYQKIYTATSPDLMTWTLNPTPILSASDHSTIDASMFLDGSQRDLLWKDDGTKATRRISIAPLSSDGLSVTGSATAIMSVTQAWEKNSVEAPSMIKRGSTYYLFYSGALFTSSGEYAVGVARASSPTANFDDGKHSTPILTGDDHLASPGHQFITQAELPGRGVTDQMFYHAYSWYSADGTKLSTPQTRKLMMDEIHWGSDNWPTVNNGHPSR